jgi:hypothetical protein
LFAFWLLVSDYWFLVIQFVNRFLFLILNFSFLIFCPSFSNPPAILRHPGGLFFRCAVPAAKALAGAVALLYYNNSIRLFPAVLSDAKNLLFNQQMSRFARHDNEKELSRSPFTIHH